MNSRTVLFLFALIVCLFFITPALYCSADRDVLELSLQECIDRVLKENLNLKSAYLGLRADDLSTEEAKSRFDPTISLNLSRREAEQPNYFEYIPVKAIRQETTNFSLSLRQDLERIC